MVQAAIMVGQHGERRVVAHRADRFLGVLDHRMQDQLEILEVQPKATLAAAQLLAARTATGSVARSDQVVDLA